MIFYKQFWDKHFCLRLLLENEHSKMNLIGNERTDFSFM